ncbi:ribosomal biogenesis protein LAS1L isoform X2 [Rhineura floridana]|uniref:ribosomal biogenesis protein LAS1L isoform X2 n=1 Tax=Rhineura floridana TaxID=261503 RepID=UPI002AC7FF5B|nr:ribosomal biogenesis protein LAS1L isoform X2 [Rhineura floridana]
MSERKRPRSVVAWQSKAEWDQVMVGLYCGDADMQRDALDRVSAWKSRYGHRMPLAVECTADLIRCKILDTSGTLESHDLVLTYGLALVRFVNLITERKQKIFNIPLRHLAKEMNIPVWIVNLRHELTHSNLPQLAACQKGCDVVLDWLRRTYWSRQLGNNLAGDWEEEEEDSPSTDTGDDSSPEEPDKSQSPGCRKHQELQEKVADVLVSYKNQQFEVLQQLQNISQACKVWCSSSSEIEWIVAQMKDLLQENREIVAGALLDDGFLIPTVEELHILNIDSQESKEWDFKIPPTLLRFWQPLLKSLHSKDFTQTLLEKMFNKLKKHTRDSECSSQYLIKWITKILKANMQSKKKLKRSYKSKSSPELFLHHVSLQWQKLLDGCLEAPCWASPRLLHLILSSMEPPLPPESQEKLLYLTSIYTQEDGSLPSPGSAPDLHRQPIYTVESLQWKVKQSGATRRLAKRARRCKMPLGATEEEGTTEEEEEVEEEEEMQTQPAPPQESFCPENSMALAEKKVALQGSVWQVSPDGVKWKDFPLGKLPGQADDPDGLLVENYSTLSALDQPVDGDKKSSPSATTSEWGSSVAEGLLWTQSELHKLKSGLQLF